MLVTTSVVIITKDRDTHLANVLQGLQASLCRPDEVVVVYMNQRVHPVLVTDLHLVEVDLPCDTRLPLNWVMPTAHNGHIVAMTAGRKLKLASPNP